MKTVLVNNYIKKVNNYNIKLLLLYIIDNNIDFIFTITTYLLLLF
jgi:hypothetical protein